MAILNLAGLKANAIFFFLFLEIRFGQLWQQIK